MHTVRDLLVEGQPPAGWSRRMTERWEMETQVSVLETRKNIVPVMPAAELDLLWADYKCSRIGRHATG